MITNRYNITTSHIGPDATEDDVREYVDFLERAGVGPNDKDARKRAWEAWCAASGDVEAALARVRCETGETNRGRTEMAPTTYTVRPRGCTAWVSGLPSLAAARAEAREARARGLRCVIITEDATGREVE
jgi:hypothetical protein